MSGKLLDAARRDIAKIVQGGGFEEQIVISDSSTGAFIEVNGLHSKHWISYSTDGAIYNSKNAHVSILESVLNEKGFVTRNEKTGNVDLKNYRISAKDSTGIVNHYVINECFPSETTGLIVCILGDLKI
jgi:hypothetical protein